VTSKMKSGPKKSHKFLILIIIIIIAAVAATMMNPMTEKAESAGARYRVTRRDLVISVTESGSLRSTNPTEIKCMVEGRATIQELIPEGTILTQKDIDAGRILVRFDDTDLIEKATQQEITYQSALADHTQAKESYGIQKNQNESDIRAGELKVKFALMDFERYLGDTAANRIFKGEVKLSVFNFDGMTTEKALKLVDASKLEGEARKQRKKLQSDIDLAEEQVNRSWSDYQWSLKLGPKSKENPKGKGYITRSDVEADRLKWKGHVADSAQAHLSLEIWLRYELPKEAEKRYSDYFEAQQELGRIKAKARAELAKALSRLKSREAALNLQKRRLSDLKTNIAACTIRVKPGQTGMAVFASTTSRRGRAQDTIEEGATVRHKQVIIRIPDTTSMSVQVKVNEAYINAVKRGQKVKIIAESMRDKVLEGTVSKVAGNVDPMRWWASIDTRTYTVDVAFDDPPERLRSGMSVQATILMDRVENVIAVPIQAVTNVHGEKVCFVQGNKEPVAVPVEIGQANDQFIAITSGLKENEEVLLYKPESFDDSQARAASTKRKATTAKAQKDAVAKAKVVLAETKPDEKTKEKKETVPDWIKKIPEAYRERVMESWRNASPEERNKMEKQAKSRMRGNRGGKRGGQGRTGGAH
jgi:HlyD family secretion protein